MTDLKEKICEIVIDGRHIAAETVANAILQAVDEAAKAECALILNKIKADMRMHTVPEGTHLITRSYLENTIDFELAALKATGRVILTKEQEEYLNNSGIMDAETLKAILEDSAKDQEKLHRQAEEIRAKLKEAGDA